jgi:hypothetical protein
MADQVTWTTADGSTVIDLTDASGGYTLLGEGTRGLRSVQYEMATQKYAGLDGEVVQSIRATSIGPTLGLLLEADDEDAFAARARALRHAMRPKAGVGTLTVRRPSGEVRTLTCYCTGGFEGDESLEVSHPGRWWKLALQFFAPAPYGPWWEGPAQTVSFGLRAPAAFFPIPPVALASSSVQGSFTVDLSDSDAPVYPTWTVTGPGSSLVLTNVTTGRSITVNAALLAGESLTIDTRPGFQSVRRNDGTSLLAALGTDPALWPLIEDVNAVSAQLVGATSASRITATFKPRYAGI